MKNVINMIAMSVLIICLVGVSGCSSKLGGGVEEAAQNQNVFFTGNIMPNSEAERVLEVHFRASTVPWDEDMVVEINKARNAILGMGEYLKDRLNFDSALPYYTYKVWFEFTSNQYMKLQNELDDRIAIEGAISEEGAIIYSYVKRDVNTLLEVQRLKISATEKSIEEKASASTIEEIKDIYSTIRPLIDLVI